MQTIPTTDLILSLIKDDLINTRLVNGLECLGLDAGHYLLHLGSTVLRLMGFGEGHLTDAVYERYHALIRRVACADLREGHGALEPMAREIYGELQNLLPAS